MRVRYTIFAADDLDRVLTDLAMKSVSGARRLKARIDAIEGLLSQFPKARLPWLRRIPTNPYPYLIFYEVMGEEVVIHAIRHAARNPSSMPG